MKISVSSYSFSQYIRAGKLTQFDTVAKAKEIGLDAIEFTEIIADDFEGQKVMAQKIHDEAERCGIEINAYTIGANLYSDDESQCEAEVERLKKQLEIAKILGVKVMRHDVCHSLTKKARSFDMMLPTIAKYVRKLTEYAATMGIRTCSENHGFIAQDSDRVERLFNAVNHENYGLLVDMGNFLCVDENPVTAVSRVAPYAFHVHAKDFIYSSLKKGILTRGGNYICGCVIGEGVVPIKQCLTAIKRTGYDGFVSIEFEGSEDCIAAITKGYNNLKAFLAEI